MSYILHATNDLESYEIRNIIQAYQDSNHHVLSITEPHLILRRTNRTGHPLNKKRKAENQFPEHSRRGNFGERTQPSSSTRQQLPSPKWKK